MDFFDLPNQNSRSEASFIEHFCSKLSLSPSELYGQLKIDCTGRNFDSRICKEVKALFSYNCFVGPSTNQLRPKMLFFTRLFDFLIAGPKGLDELTTSRMKFCNHSSLFSQRIWLLCEMQSSLDWRLFCISLQDVWPYPKYVTVWYLFHGRKPRGARFS